MRHSKKDRKLTIQVTGIKTLYYTFQHAHATEILSLKLLSTTTVALCQGFTIVTMTHGLPYWPILE